MRFPEFLIIGAMKAGTTSLFFDLRSNPSIYLPEDKEPGNLTRDEVLTQRGRAVYAGLFRKARRDQICGEASTTYSKLPNLGGVPARARRLLGKEVKILYLVREPVSRTLSHHYHELTAGTVPPNVDQAVREHPRLIQYSLYAQQIRPWIESFGEDRIRIIRFEDFIRDRHRTVGAISDFLGVESRLAGVAAERIYNSSEDAAAPRGLAWRFSRGAMYRNFIRPWLSPPVRLQIGKLLMPKAPSRPAPPSLETVDYLLEQVSDDASALREIVGSHEPLWDLDAVRWRFARQPELSSTPNSIGARA